MAIQTTRDLELAMSSSRDAYLLELHKMAGEGIEFALTMSDNIPPANKPLTSSTSAAALRAPLLPPDSCAFEINSSSSDIRLSMDTPKNLAIFGSLSTGG